MLRILILLICIGIADIPWVRIAQNNFSLWFESCAKELSHSLLALLTGFNLLMQWTWHIHCIRTYFNSSENWWSSYPYCVTVEGISRKYLVHMLTRTKLRLASMWRDLVIISLLRENNLTCMVKFIIGISMSLRLYFFRKYMHRLWKITFTH